MRILVVHPRMSTKGGGERVAIHSMRACVKAGHLVSLISEEFDTSDFEDFFGCRGLFDSVEKITYQPFKPRLRKNLLLYQRLVYHQASLRKALSRHDDFDLLLGTQDIGYVPDEQSPLIQYCYFPEYFSHLETSPSSAFWKLYYLPASIFYRNRVRRVSRFLSVSDYTKQFVSRKWGRSSETVYPPCPVELYYTGEKKENTIITAGRIVPEKRLHLFVEMARALPLYRFVIVGSVEASTRDYYESLLRRAPSNLSVVVSPLRKQREILSMAKAYVHCAINEHFGITIVEAMAAGCVPVVHDSGGPREIVNGLVGYRWREMSEAVSQIDRLMKDDGLRKPLSKAAVARSAIYRPAVFESRLAKVVDEYQV